VRGPEEVLSKLRAIPTQPCTVPARPGSPTASETITVGPVPLLQEQENRVLRVVPERVVARVTLQPRKLTYDLPDVTVQFLCPPNFGLRPVFIGDGQDGKLSLRVIGPPAEERPVVLAYIDLTRRTFGPGLHTEPLRIQLPKDYQLAQDPPRLVPFELLKPLTEPARGTGGVGVGP
jgi:hypothetical protein